MNFNTSWLMKKILFTFLMTALLALQANAETLLGDLNGDNEVNITDVNLLTSAISAGNNDAIYDLNGDGAINITDLSVLLEIAMAINPEPDFEIEGEHATGWWIVAIDAEGNHVWKEFKEAEPNSYFHNAITFNYGPYGTSYWDPELSYEENCKNIPNVPFCFVLDGVRYGPSVSMKRPAIWCNYPGHYPKPYSVEMNPLVKGNKYFSVPVGGTYHYGISIDEETGELYLIFKVLYAGV